MNTPLSDDFRRLLEAASFAARAHHRQLRKDGQTPYAAHPFRVALIVRHAFNITDSDCLTAAILHDVIEDTDTDFDDVLSRFGSQVATYVAALTKDKRLPEQEREQVYLDALRSAPAPVKIAKLADVLDNLLDSRHLTGTQRRQAITKAQRYLDALRTDLPGYAQGALALVQSVLEETQSTFA